MKEIKISESNEVLYTFNTSTNLPVYMWVNDKKKNTYMGLGVKYGSAGTNFKCNGIKYNVPTGIAHYLEHIKFYLNDCDASELFTDLGCDSNAYTSFKETVFEVYANDNIYDAAKLLLDFVHNDYFSKQIVENERGVIIEEANSGKDNPEYEFHINFLKNYFLKSNFKNSVIGTEKDISEISLEDIKLVYDFFYRPENMFLVITGNFDPKKMEEEILKNESKRIIKAVGDIKVIDEIETDELKTNSFEVKSLNCKNTKAKLTIKTSLKTFKGYKKEEVLVALRALCSAKYGSSSDFYESLMQSNLATDFYTYVSYDAGVVSIEFNYCSQKDKKVKELILESLKFLMIDNEELNRFKKYANSRYIMKFDNIYGVAASIIYNLVENDTPQFSEMSVINSLTTKKVNDIYRKVKINNYLYGLLKPKSK